MGRGSASGPRLPQPCPSWEVGRLFRRLQTPPGRPAHGPPCCPLTAARREAAGLGVVQSPPPGPVCAGQGCAQQDRCRLRGVPGQSGPPGCSVFLYGRGRGAAPGSWRRRRLEGLLGQLQDQTRHRKTPCSPEASQSPNPTPQEDGPQRKLPPHLPGTCHPVWLNHTNHFPAQSLPSAA